MNQKLIWDHFQSENIEIFDGSGPRLSFLVNQALKIFKKCNVGRPAVLNIGVGNGGIENQCCKRGWKTYSLDPSEGAIKRILDNGGNGKVGLIENIPYDSNFFDLVFCSEVLEHLSDEQLNVGLKEIKRVLVNNGHLIGTVPFNEILSSNQAVCPNCGEFFHRWGHQQSFDIAKMRTTFENLDFCINSIMTYAFPDFSRKGFKNRTKSWVRYLLGRFGSGISQPNIYFSVRK